MSFIKKTGSIIITPFKSLYKKVKQFFERFSRSCKWFVRMWGNYDWDHEYLIEMMLYKLKDMRYQLDVKDSWFVDLRHQPVNFTHPDDSDYETTDNLAGLDKAIELGERILKHDYIQYPPDIQEWYDTHNMFEDKMSESMRKKLMRVYKKSDYDEQKDRRLFFDIIKKEHQKWWS